MISLRHEVERKEHREAQGREEQSGQQCALLPLSALERLVQDGARVARRYPHEHVQQQHRYRQAPAVGRVHEPGQRMETSIFLFVRKPIQQNLNWRWRETNTVKLKSRRCNSSTYPTEVRAVMKHMGGTKPCLLLSGQRAVWEPRCSARNKNNTSFRSRSSSRPSHVYTAVHYRPVFRACSPVAAVH